MPRLVASKQVVVAEPIPAASEISTVVEETPETVVVEEDHSALVEALMSTLEGLSAAEMAKVMKLALAIKKKEEKEAKKPASKKKEAEPKEKKPVPKQLMKPRAWVEFTLKHALANGWEAFVIHQKTKVKGTNEVEEEEIEMPGSEYVESLNCYVYEGTFGTAKYPKGRQIIQKEAMSLSKERWSPKAKTGTHPELYEEFEAQYEEPEIEDSKSETTESSSGKTVRRLTAAEKEAEQEAKKAAKEAEKAAKKAEKEAEKEAKKAAKEAEKAAKAAEKKTAAPKKTATTTVKAPITATAAKAPTTVKAPTTAKIPTVTTAAASAGIAVKRPTVAPKKDTWTCPDDGNVYPWSFNGKDYLRNISNEVWEFTDGEIGAWAGTFDRDSNKILPTPEPDYSE